MMRRKQFLFMKLLFMMIGIVMIGSGSVTAYIISSSLGSVRCHHGLQQQQNHQTNLCYNKQICYQHNQQQNPFTRTRTRVNNIGRQQQQQNSLTSFTILSAVTKQHSLDDSNYSYQCPTGIKATTITASLWTRHLPKGGAVMKRTTTTKSSSSCLRATTTPSDSSSESVAPPNSNNKSLLRTIFSTYSFILLDYGFRQLFSFFKVPFPASLGACAIVFTTLLFVSPKSLLLYQTLQPGAMFLSKWLPVFFVPSLILLPLADSVGAVSEFLKIALVIVGGFFVSLFASAGTVVLTRQLLGSSSSSSSSTSSGAVAVLDPPPLPPTTTTTKPFSDMTYYTLLLSSIIFGGLSVWLSNQGTGIVTTKAVKLFGLFVTPPSLGIHYVQSIFLLCVTLCSFVFGVRLPKTFTKLVHPLVTCTGLTWLTTKGLAVCTGRTMRSILKTYKNPTIQGIQSIGAGDVLLSFLGPAVIALAVSMYEKRKLMKENFIPILASVVSSTVSGLFGTAFAVRTLGIVSPYLRLSLLSRNITSPLALAIGGILGADISMAVTFVVVTGLIGANFGATLLDWVGIKDPVARGLGIGAAAHGLGTAAFANEKDAFPFAAISMALTATVATVLNTALAANSTHPLFLVFGVEFYQDVNGVKYPLKNGSYNALSIVKVDGV